MVNGTIGTEHDIHELLNGLIEALREELKQYGEMLARFDDPWAHRLNNAEDAALAGATSLREQETVIENARRKREEIECRLARQLRLPDEAGHETIVAFLPASHQPLVRALMEENHDLALLIQTHAY